MVLQYANMVNNVLVVANVGAHRYVLTIKSNTIAYVVAVVFFASMVKEDQHVDLVEALEFVHTIRERLNVRFVVLSPFVIITDGNMDVETVK